MSWYRSEAAKKQVEFSTCVALSASASSQAIAMFVEASDDGPRCITCSQTYTHSVDWQSQVTFSSLLAPDRPNPVESRWSVLDHQDRPPFTDENPPPRMAELIVFGHLPASHTASEPQPELK